LARKNSRLIVTRAPTVVQSPKLQSELTDEFV
jgi:hypothetical protein